MAGERIALTNGIVGEGRALYQAVVAADLEGIVAKKLADPYNPKLVRWHKILNRGYSQRQGRAERFRERRGSLFQPPETGAVDFGYPPTGHSLQPWAVPHRARSFADTPLIVPIDNLWRSVSIAV